MWVLLELRQSGGTGPHCGGASHQPICTKLQSLLNPYRLPTICSVVRIIISVFNALIKIYYRIEQRLYPRYGISFRGRGS